MKDEETFHAAFDGASVTIKIDYSLFGKHKNVAELFKYEWDAKPSRQIIPQYVAWMHTVMCHVAKRVNQKILYAYPPGGGDGPEFYVYHADGTYERANPSER